MSKHQREPRPETTHTSLDLSHLRRQTRTALELAVVAMVPSDLLDRLAAAAGLLEALIELPPNSPPVIALIPVLSKRAHSALEDWDEWQAEHLSKLKA